MPGEAFAPFSALAESGALPPLSSAPALNPNHSALSLHLDNTCKRLNSSRDPAAEAQRLAGRWKDEKLLSVGEMNILVGFNGPELPDAICGLLSHGGLLLVIEPNPALMAAIIGHCKLDALEKWEGQLSFCPSNDPGYIVATLKDALRKRLQSHAPTVAVPELERLFNDQYRQLRNDIAAVVELELRNRSTIDRLAHKWYVNSMLNLQLHASEPYVDKLQNAFQNHAAIVAAAGPSLNSMIPVISRLQEHTVVIAVGTALKPLLAHNIQPDFIVVVDAAQEIESQFPAQAPEHSFFVAPPSVSPRLFSLFKHQCFIFSGDHLPGYKRWIAQTQPPPASLKIGGTVAASAIDLAVWLGCSDIILAGLDLAYGKDLSTHAHGSVYTTCRGNAADCVMIPDNLGGSVPTSIQFRSYVRIIDDFLARLASSANPPRIYNTSLQGARITHSTAISPEKVQELSFSRVKIDKYAYIVRLKDENKGRNGIGDSAWKLAVNLALAQFKEFRRYLESAGKLCAGIDPGPGAFPDHVLRQLEEIDGKLRTLSAPSLLMEGMIEAMCVRLQQNKNHDFSAVLASTSGFYGQLAEHAAFAVECLESTAGEHNTIIGD